MSKVNEQGRKGDDRQKETDQEEEKTKHKDGEINTSQTSPAAQL